MTVREVINESLGEFSMQYILAKEIAEKTLSMIKKHTKKLTYKSKVGAKFETVIINVQYSQDDEDFRMMLDVRPTHGTFAGVNDTTISISFFIARNDILSLTDNELINKIYSIAVHELNHGYVILSQAKYNQKRGKELVNSLPEWYDKCINFLQNYKRVDIAYGFVQALYACYEKEINAIVSETTPQICNYMVNKNKQDRDTFIEALENSEPFQRYYNALYEVLPQIKENKDRLISVLNFWKFDFNEKTFDEICDFIERKSTMALKYVEKNAMLYYHNNIKLGKTDWFETHK